MATKKMTYREAEDLIAHYAPAWYLCDLMDSDWHLDHVTIFDFTTMLGDTGMAQINESIFSKAEDCGFLDSSVLMSDTTVQEAMIPYPTEVGLMSRFGQLVQKAVGKTGWKISSCEEQCQRASEDNQGIGAQFSFVCKRKGSEGQSGAEDLSHSEVIACRTLYDAGLRIKVNQQRRPRTHKTCRSDGQAIAANFPFYNDRVCRQQKNHPFANSRALLHRPWQGRQKGRVWSQVGNQSNWRWIASGLSSHWRASRFRSKLLFASDQTPSKKFWRSTKNLWFRPRWLQCLKYQEGKKSLNKACWHSSNWQNSLGGERVNAQENSARAGPSRGWCRNDQVESIWLQQTQCKEHSGNGSVRPTGDFGLQYEETDQGVVRSADTSGDELEGFSPRATKTLRRDEKRYGMCG